MSSTGMEEICRNTTKTGKLFLELSAVEGQVVKTGLFYTQSVHFVKNIV